MPDENGNPVSGVADEWIVVDDLPPEDPRASGSRESVWDSKLERVKTEVDPGKAVCIRTYDNKNAAAAAATHLKRRFGKTPDAYGYTFAVRKVKLKGGVEKRGLFVKYEPAAVVKGAQAKQDKEYGEWKVDHDQKLKEQAAARKHKKDEAKAGTPG